jgi:virginiamycin B lyase
MDPMSSARCVGGRRTPRTQRPWVLALEGRTLLAASPRVDLFALPTIAAYPDQIVDGSDGDLWFNERSGAIGRISTQGQVVEFPLPDPIGGVAPEIGGLTAGPDGAIWAIDEANAQIDRIAPDGQIETFAIPGATGATGSGDFIGSGSIALGPDGAPAGQLGTIDRITPEGVVTAFPLPIISCSTPPAGSATAAINSAGSAPTGP